jgi:hypothetical protein
VGGFLEGHLDLDTTGEGEVSSGHLGGVLKESEIGMIR